MSLRSMAKDLNLDVAFLSRIERGLVATPDYILRTYQNRFGEANSNHVQLLLPIDGANRPKPYNSVSEPYIAVKREHSGLAFESPAILSDQASPDADDALPSFSWFPNPHLGDFARTSRPPKEVPTAYSHNISAGKNTYVYDAHTYHTKVPPEGIKRLIEYYTRPGDVVLDPFSGSGMTGVAALELGRKALLVDLSPAATFISYNLNTPVPSHRYLQAVNALLDSLAGLEERLYTTHCRTCGRPTPLLYMVWSYGMVCKHCGQEFILWDVARDERPSVRESEILTEFDCPHCGRHLKKRELTRTRRYPVQVGYKCCQAGLRESTAPPDKQDKALLSDVEQEGVPLNLWYPKGRFPVGVNTAQPIRAGVKRVDQAYTPRALWAMAALWNAAKQWPDREMRPKLLFTLTSLYQRVTVFSEFRFWGGSGNTANYNVPAIMNEQNVFKAFRRKANTIALYFGNAPMIPRDLRVSTQSACHLPQLPPSSVDYVFTHPPFGGNINYSEMNFLWESWLGSYTNNAEEAIINRVQHKDVKTYQKLLTNAFSETRRVLKDGGWLTVVFHNSSAEVWRALQNAIADAGFLIRGTQTFDKKHGTFKQFVSDNAVGYDLVLHCQKTFTSQNSERMDKQGLIGLTAAFIKSALIANADSYTVRYTHVSRKDEFNYRRLYAEWLAQSVAETTVSLDFNEFRTLVDNVIRKEPMAIA